MTSRGTAVFVHGNPETGAVWDLLLGHWWMVQDPRQAAQVLTTFWSQLP